MFDDPNLLPNADLAPLVALAERAGLSIAAIAHNLLRAAGALASLPFAKAPAHEPRTSRTTGERQDAHARNHPGNSSCRNQAGNDLTESVGGSRLSAIFTAHQGTVGETNAAPPV